MSIDVLDFVHGGLEHMGIPAPPRLNLSGFTRWGKNNKFYMVVLPPTDGFPLFGMIVGDFSTGETHKIYSRKPKKSEKTVFYRLAQAVQQKDTIECVAEINRLWNMARPVTSLSSHSYLAAKGINRAEGVRLLPNHRFKAMSLVIPITNPNNRIVGLQEIVDVFSTEDGRDYPRRFFPGSLIRGNYFMLGKPEESPIIYVAEGFATAFSVHASTGCAVACAFNAGNLRPVCLSLADRYPQPLYVAADNDLHLPVNIGVEKGLICCPPATHVFVAPSLYALPNKGVDFNDVFVARGAEECARFLKTNQSF